MPDDNDALQQIIDQRRSNIAAFEEFWGRPPTATEGDRLSRGTPIREAVMPEFWNRPPAVPHRFPPATPPEVARHIKADPADRHHDRPSPGLTAPRNKARTYRSLPVTIQAMLFDGTPMCVLDVIEWMQLQFVGEKAPAYATEAGLQIETLEGVMLARPGDFIIMGTRGEFYPCKPDVFVNKYEEMTWIPSPRPAP